MTIDTLFNNLDKFCTEEEQEALLKLYNIYNESYIIITWPESQRLMEEEWFEKEAILETKGIFGSSAYFVPVKRISI